MTGSYLLVTILEILAGAFIIWGVFNENSLVDFEDKIFIFIKHLCLKRKHKSTRRERCRADARYNNASAYRSNSNSRIA